jgi:hypothetical protein
MENVNTNINKFIKITLKNKLLFFRHFSQGKKQLFYDEDSSVLLSVLSSPCFFATIGIAPLPLPIGDFFPFLSSSPLSSVASPCVGILTLWVIGRTGVSGTGAGEAFIEEEDFS